MTMTRIEEADYQHNLLLDEIITEILLRLPVKSVMECKVVCKTWRALIVDPLFVNLYHQKLKLHPRIIADDDEWVTLCWKSFISNGEDKFYFGEYNDNDGSKINPFKHSPPVIYRPHPPITASGAPDYRVWRRNTVCSCNGLIFFISVLSNDIFVCNPFTREYVDLPPLNFDRKRFIDMFLHYGISLATGFGYNSYTNEYKIVFIHYTNKHYWECTTGYVSVYTFGSGRWRDKGEISPKLIHGTQPGVFFNGALHWLTEKKEIVSFDLADEEFRIVPSPPSQPAADDDDDDDDYVPQLGLLRGSFYVTRKQKIKGGFDSTLDIWVKDDNDQPLSWTRKFSITWKLGDNLSADYYRPLALSKSGKLVLFHSIGNMPLVSYDPETESSIVDDTFSSEPSNRFIHIRYVKRLVTLKALGEMNAVDYQISYKASLDDHDRVLPRDIGSSLASHNSIN